MSVLRTILDRIDPPIPVPYTVPRGSLSSADEPIHWIIKVGHKGEKQRVMAALRLRYAQD